MNSLIEKETPVDLEANRRHKLVLSLGVQNPQALQALQRWLFRYPSFTPKPPSKFHTTLMYYGTVPELYAEVTRVTHVAYPMFHTRLRSLVTAAYAAPIPDTIAHVRSLEMFGDTEAPVVAAQLEVADAILNARETMHQGLIDFLLDMGISDIDAFMQGSKIFRFHKGGSFNPHVTLGRWAGSGRDWSRDVQVNGLQIHLSGLI
jgi:hypothetical protein